MCSPPQTSFSRSSMARCNPNASINWILPPKKGEAIPKLVYCLCTPAAQLSKPGACRASKILPLRISACNLAWKDGFDAELDIAADCAQRAARKFLAVDYDVAVLSRLLLILADAGAGLLGISRCNGARELISALNAYPSRQTDSSETALEAAEVSKGRFGLASTHKPQSATGECRAS